MTTISSTLQINLVEDATKTAPRVAAALEKMQKEATALQAALAKSGTTDKLQARLKTLGATEAHIDGVTKAWNEFAKAEGLAEHAAGWTQQQAIGVKRWEDATVAAVRLVKKEEATLARARHDQQASAIKEASRAAAEEKRLAAEAARDARRLAEQAARDKAFFAQQALRDEERAQREHIALMERETREAKRQDEARARLAQQEAHREREAISRGGITHYAASGAAAGLAAHSLVDKTEIAVEQGADVQHARVEMAKAGMSAKAIRDIEIQAYALSAQVRNVSPVAIMDLAKEARSVLTEQADLAKVLPALTKAKSVLDARDASGEASGSLALLVKGAENIGAAKNPERLAKLIDGAVKAMQVMGKTIDAEQYYAFLKNSRLAGAQFSDRFIMTTGMSALQEMGGQTAGKAANEVQSELIGGLEHRNVAVRALKRLKLIDGKDIQYSKIGEVTGVRKGRLHVVKGDEKLAHDLDLWVYQDLLPAMERAGITKTEDQLAMTRQVFSGSKTAQDLVGKLITQRESYQAHGAMYGQASGIEGYKLNAEDAGVALTSLTVQLKSFAGAVTSPMMKDAGHVLDDAAGALGRLAVTARKFAEDHPIAAEVGAGAATAGALGTSGLASWWAYKKLTGLFKGEAQTTATSTAEKVPSGLFDKIKGGGASAAETLGLYAMLAAWAAQSDVVSFTPEQLEAMKREVAAHPDRFKASDALRGPQIAGKRAGGGPVSQGKTYLVGEHGPELFTPGMNGAISTADVQRMLARSTPADRIDGDGETAKAVRSMSFELVSAVDGIARAVDRAGYRAERFDRGAGDVGADGESSGRRAFMNRPQGHTVPGHDGGGRRGFMNRPDHRIPDGRGAGSRPSHHEHAGHGRPIDNDGSSLRGGRPASNRGLTAKGQARIDSWMNFFQRSKNQGGMGLPKDKAQSMIAMMQGESGINLRPDQEVYDVNGPSGGTAMWHNVDGKPGGRLAGLKAFAARLGKSWKDVGVQQAWWKHEAETTHRRAFSAIEAAKDADGALVAGIGGFEVPRDPQGEARKRRGYLRRLQQAPGTPESGVANSGHGMTDDPLGIRKKRHADHVALADQLRDLDQMAVSPDIDHAPIQKFIGHIRTAQAELAKLHGAKIGRAGAGGTQVAGLASRTRGSFTSGGLTIG